MFKIIFKILFKNNYRFVNFSFRFNVFKPLHRKFYYILYLYYIEIIDLELNNIFLYSDLDLFI